MRTLKPLSMTAGLVLASGIGLAPVALGQNTLGSYTATPPFVTQTVTPNILILLDNSLSMRTRVCGTGTCGILPNGTYSTDSRFLETTQYTGYLDSKTCYIYDAANSRYDVSSTRSNLGDQCANTEWDGNFLNYMQFLEFDALKKALTGGDCAVARNADGTCPAIGSPAKSTTVGQRQNISWFVITMYKNGTNITYNGVPNTKANNWKGRVPDSVSQNANTLYFYWRNDRPGKVCVNDNYLWPSSNQDCVWYWVNVITGYVDNHHVGHVNGQWTTVCDLTVEGVCAQSHKVWQNPYDYDYWTHDAVYTSVLTQDIDGFTEQEFDFRIAHASEPIGVIQQIGNRARFGLEVFQANDVTVDGGKVLVGIGARQRINWTNGTVTTYTTNNAAMISAVELSYPYTQTPLAETFYDTVRYIAQINSTYTPTAYSYPIAFAGGNSNGAAFGTAGVGSFGASEISALSVGESCPSGYIARACGRDPYFFGSNHTPPWSTTSTVVPCCQTYIIIVTDGSPTLDQNIPAALQDYGHGTPADPAAGSVHGLHCTGGNTTIHVANGTCNSNPTTPASTLLKEHKTDYPLAGHYLDDVALWAHTTDLRQGTIPVINEAGHDLPGVQNVTVYTFFCFGSIDGREYLMNAAKQGGFIDANNNNIPDLTSEWDQVNNYTGAQTPDGIPDAYFESSNADDLEAKFLSTVQSILHRSTSGSSISVLATSGTGEGSLYQAYFYPKSFEGDNEIDWLGYAQGLFMDGFGNIREDTNGDGRLSYPDDQIIRTRYDTNSGNVFVDRYVDADGNGKADASTPSSTVQLNQVAPIWEAGKVLALRDASTRTIRTWVDQNNDSIVQSSEEMDFAQSNLATLTPYLDADTIAARDIVDFIRGNQPNGTRNRQITVGSSLQVWKLGDPVNSTPTVVAGPAERYDVLYGDSSYSDYYTKYRNRRMMVYVGANDGMLHAFNGGFYHRGDDSSTTTKVEHGWFTTDSHALGDEMWGYVPYQLLPFLKYLARTDYTHLYYVDLKPKVTDARIFTPDTTHPNGWGTVLIGGFRMGGSCGNCVSGTGGAARTVTADFGAGVQTRTFYSAYFALDVTDPEQPPKLLWAYTDSSLGFTTSYPSVLRVKPSCVACDKTDNTDARWLMLVGDGPTTYDGTSLQPNNQKDLFAVDLSTGSLVGSFTTGDAQAFMGMPITVDIDLDYRVDIAYAGTVQCNKDPSNSDGDNNRCTGTNTPTWSGALYRLTTTGCANAPCTTAGWGGTTHGPTVVLAQFPLASPQPVGPITVAPTAAMDDSNQLWVMFGSGRYYGIADKTDAQQQYFFGVKDPVPLGGCTQTSTTNCERRDLVNTSDVVVCSVCTGSTNQVTSSLAGVISVEGSTTTSLQGLIKTKQGWYTTLPAQRERLVSSPIILGGILFFPSFVPGNDACSAAGEGYLYALFYQTGSAPKDPVIGTTTSGSNTVVNRALDLGEGVPSQMAVQIGAQGTDASGGGTGQGCQQQVTLVNQSSTGATNQVCGGTRFAAWSRMVSWNVQRD